jgi:hypothetical protein
MYAIAASTRRSTNRHVFPYLSRIIEGETQNVNDDKERELAFVLLGKRKIKDFRLASNAERRASARLANWNDFWPAGLK